MQRNAGVSPLSITRVAGLAQTRRCCKQHTYTNAAQRGGITAKYHSCGRSSTNKTTLQKIHMRYCISPCSMSLHALRTRQCFFFIFFIHIYFQASGQVVVTVSSLLPPGSCIKFLSRIGFSNPTARRFFIDCC